MELLEAQSKHPSKNTSANDGLPIAFKQGTLTAMNLLTHPPTIASTGRKK